MKNLDFIDCAPNMGALTFQARQKAEELGLDFVAPVSGRAAGYEYQHFETLEGGLKGLFLDKKGKWVEVETVRENGPGSTFLKAL